MKEKNSHFDNISCHKKDLIVLPFLTNYSCCFFRRKSSTSISFLGALVPDLKDCDPAAMRRLLVELRSPPGRVRVPSLSWQRIQSHLHSEDISTFSENLVQHLKLVQFIKVSSQGQKRH